MEHLPFLLPNYDLIRLLSDLHKIHTFTQMYLNTSCGYIHPFIATSIRIGRRDRCRCTCNGQDSVVPDSVLVGISCLYFQAAAKRDVRSVLDCQSRSRGRCRVDLCALIDQNTLCGVIDQHAFTIGKSVLDCTVERGCCRSGFCNGGFRIFPIITILRDRDIIAPLGQIQRLDFCFHRYISISGQGQFFTARYRLTVIFEDRCTCSHTRQQCTCSLWLPLSGKGL